jgi:hypothetical protein
MDSADIVNKHALYTKYGMYIADAEKLLANSETCAA